MRNLSNTDSRSWDRIVDVLNEVFQKRYKGWQRASCPVGSHGVQAWFPKMAVIKNGKYTSPVKEGRKQWLNVMYVDGKYIRMYTDDNHLKTKDGNWGRVCYCFGMMQDGKYHFLGIYVKTKTNNSPYEAIFERIGTSIDLDNWDVEIYLPMKMS